MSTAEPEDALASSSSPSSSAEPTEDLREVLAEEIATLLELDVDAARKIVDSFDERIAKPLETKFAALAPQHLAQRNPFFYAVLGVTSVDDWVERALADRETSALEGHVGTWLEDVARIVSGGFKPGGGVDVQRNIDDDTVELYALQMAASTKSGPAAQQEIVKLRQAAAPLRTHGMRVTTYVGVMFGRKSSRAAGSDPNILKPSSDELWARLTGQKNFLPRLLAAASRLSILATARAADDAARLKTEAAAVFASDDGTLDLGKLADPPRRARRRRRTTKPETPS